MTNNTLSTVIGESQQQSSYLQKLLDLSLDVICSFDLFGKFMTVTKAAKDVWGFAPEELIGSNYRDFIHPDDLAKTSAAISVVMSGVSLTNIENRFTRKDGSLVPLLWSARWDEETKRIYCVAKDATAIVKANKQAKDYEQKLYRAYKLAGIGWWEWNAETNKNTVSDELYEIYGLNRTDCPDLSTEVYLSLVHPEDLPSILEIIDFSQQKDINHYEHRMIKPSGEVIYVSHHVQMKRDENGHLIRIHGTTKDITECKAAELGLKESKDRYEYISKATFDAIWDFNFSTGMLYRSEGFSDMFGHASTEAAFDIDWMKSCIHPEDWERVLDCYQKVIKGRETIWFQEFRLLKNDGSYADVQEKGIVVRDGRGWATRMIGAVRDISETKYLQALEQLEKDILEMNALSNQSLQEILTHYIHKIESLHPGMVCSILERKENRLNNFCSPQLPKAYTDAIEGIAIGLNQGSCGTAAFLKEKVIVEDIANDSRWKAYKDFALQHNLRSCWSQPLIDTAGNVMATFAVYHSEVKLPTVQQENTVQRASHLLQVILENHQKEKALKESNQRHELVSKATSDTIWDWDLITGKVSWGDAIETVFGYQAKSLKSDLGSWIELLHPGDIDRVISSIDQAIQNGDTHWTCEYRYKKADGTFAYVFDRGFIIRDSRGKAVRMTGAMQDVSRQKEAEQSLKLSEERFKLLFYQSPKPKWIFKEDSLQIIEVNDAALELYGYTKSEFLQLVIPDVILKADLAILLEMRSEKNNNIIRNIKKNQEEFYADVTTHTIDLPSGRHFIVLVEDMTEKLRLQQTLIEEKVKAQKRIGEAVLKAQEKERGEIGRELHDNVNQILTSVKLYQDLALAGGPNEKEFIKKSMELLTVAINENRSLSKRLSAPTLGNIKLTESVEELVELVRSTNKFKIELNIASIFGLETDQEIHLAIYRILQEHFTNIQKYAEASYVKVSLGLENNDLLLKIKDNGKGFDTRVKRMGIGISNMVMRAESLGGSLIVNSSPGLGCVLTVRIPYTAAR